MSPRRRRRKPLVLEEMNWSHWILNHTWDRTPRDQVSHDRFVELEALARDFLIEHPTAVASAIAAARAGHEDPGIEEVFEALHPALKAFAATRGIELVDYDPSPY